jgi:hypothetical protein
MLAVGKGDNATQCEALAVLHEMIVIEPSDVDDNCTVSRLSSTMSS